MKCGHINIRSLRNKTCFVAESLSEYNLDLLCITETWLLPSDGAIVSATLPSSYSFHHIPRATNARGGGVGLIFSKALSNLKVIPNSLDASSFEILEIEFSRFLQNLKLVIIYRPGHPGTDRVFMEEFGCLLERLSTCRATPVICGDFNYWLDNPSMKPYSHEFISLLDMNNMANHVLGPTHISGHTLDLVLSPLGTELVNQVEVSLIDHRISDHAMITFELNITRPASYSKTITFRSYRRMNRQEIAGNIEGDLLGAVSRGLTSEQCVGSYNGGFILLRDRFCPLITKEIIVKDDADWYDHRVVSLRRERRRAERRWQRTGTDTARTVFQSARRAVVKQIYSCKVEYYQNQMSLCDGDQQRAFTFLNNLLGRKTDPVLPISSSGEELASRFSTFFKEKIVRIRREIEAVDVNEGFSVDFSLSFTRSSTFSQFIPVTDADVLRYVRETRKTHCPLDPINVSKLGEAYEIAVPAVKVIINFSFAEGHFPTSEKRGLIRPYLKKVGLDTNDMSNYRPFTNLSHLSKIMERAILDQLVPFLERVGAIPLCQSAYRKFLSTETALCKIYNDLVSNTCNGKVSLLVPNL